MIELDGVTWRSFTVSDNIFSRISGKLYAEVARDGFVATVTMEAERLGTSSGSVGDTAGAIEPAEWDYAQSVGGLARAAVTAVFKTRALAVSFTQSIRTGNMPDWLPAGTWQFTAQPVYKFEQQLQQTSPVPETAYTPCRVTIFLSELPASLASTMKSNKCKDMAYRVEMRPAPPLNVNAGHAPGHEISIAGSLNFQVEGNTGFDTGDTVGNGRQTEAGLKAAAEAMIDAIVTNAGTRLAVTFTKLAQSIDIAGESGAVSFTCSGITGSATRVMSWSETARVTFGFQGELFTLSTGAQGTEGNKAGEAITVEHRLDVISLGAVAYRKPAIITGDRWLLVEFTPEVPNIEASEDGPTKYTQGWSASWKYLSEANGQPSGDLATLRGQAV